jgi:hypothetical protein
MAAAAETAHLDTALSEEVRLGFERLEDVSA